MGLIEKIKAFFAARKIVQNVGEIQRGWKTVGFWFTLIGNCLSFLAAYKGHLPPHVALILMGSLTASYNILRGAKKSEESGVRAWWKTTEFWMGVGTEVSTVLLHFKEGGINAPYLIFAQSVVAGAMTIARDLAHLQPSTEDSSMAASISLPTPPLP